jgi:hypothetical protein
MPGIQITVSSALMGSSHLVQIISVETVPYTPGFISRPAGQGHHLGVLGSNSYQLAAVILAGTVGWQPSSEAGSPHGG